MNEREESIIALRLLNLERTVKDYEDTVKFLLKGTSHNRTCARINGTAQDICSCGLDVCLKKFGVS